MFVIVVAGVFQFKTLRQIEIKLNCAKLPYAADGVLDLDIDLRAIKRGLAFDAVVRNISLVQCARKLFFRADPIFFRA